MLHLFRAGFGDSMAHIGATYLFGSPLLHTMTNRKEFHELIPIGRAEELLRSIIHSSTETVPLDLAYHSVLDEDVFAPIDVPSFDRADMDGYAVRAADTYSAREEEPVQLVIAGRIPAGAVPSLTLSEGTAAEISTGAMLPAGADAVVMVEYTKEGESSSSVSIYRAVHVFENVMRAGADIRGGTRVLPEGTLLGSRETGVLAAIGVSHVRVRSLRIGIISTGNELVPAGEKPELGQVYDVNVHTISAAVRECGATPVAYGIVSDDEKKTVEVLRRAISECDLILTSGSTSAGSGDIMPRILEECGEVLAHGINIKPGKPMIIAKMEKPVVGLPGFPTSALSMFYYLIAPRIRDVLGYVAGVAARPQQAMLGSMIQSVGRHQLLPVALVRGMAYPVIKGSGAITALASADGFIEIRPETEIMEAGEVVEVTLFGDAAANDLVFAGAACDEVNRLMEMLPFRVRMIHTGVTSGIDALRNGIADIAGIPLSTDELPDMDGVSVIHEFLHGDEAYTLIVLHDQIDSDNVKAFLSAIGDTGAA
ncbi:MAG: molybdopterin biosynthesis protein [Candidatus Methanogaster sp.]|uniref:Molybdopterin biosynthesis protein n=1 Tax=Candidatus Methanogaster sp. TaxID=3386292 RepID=A0AC61L039_9EURY|nr:MAG: molybdopterin biosynthesis protein [ANME-2 cluster archaeon]